MEDPSPPVGGQSSSRDPSPAMQGATTANTTPEVSIDPAVFASPASRKAFLLDLVPRLSLDEVWMLQARLARLDLRTDVFGRLPPELQIMVTDQLAPADLGCCLHVSPTWRATFLHEALRRDLARRCFPSLLEYVEAVGEEALDSFSERAIDQIFAETARRYAIRAQGRFRYVFRHCEDPPLVIKDGRPVEDDGSTGTGRGERTTSWLRQRAQLRRKEVRFQPQPQHIDPEPQRVRFFGYGEQEAADPGGDDDGISGRPDDDGSSYPTRAVRLTYTTHEYAYGRLAWQCITPMGTSFLVDDLRDGQRLRFDMENSTVRGETYMLSAFGDEVLIASTGIRLHAWHFTTGEHHHKLMPTQVDLVATLGRRVCILCAGNIYCWELGGPLLQVNTAALDARHRQPDRDGRLPSFFLLDPVQDNVFFLGNFELDTTDELGSNGDLCFYVHEFQALRYTGATYAHRIPFRNAAFPGSLIEATVRRDARGLYSLATWRVVGETGAPARSSWAATQVEGIGSLAFNIYTHTFSESFFRLPPLAPSVGGREQLSSSHPYIRVHIWNDQLLTLIDRHRESSSKVRRATPLLFAFDDERSEAAARSPAQPFSAVPLYTSRVVDDVDPSCELHPPPERRRKVRFDELAPAPDSPGRWQQDDEDWARNRCLLRFALDLDARPAGGGYAGASMSHKPAHIGSYHVQGDDDFLVFHHENEYTVWSFGADVVANSLAALSSGSGGSDGASDGGG